ncbi:MAG: hypothetical protein WC383_15005 [Gammaproteobacteria bacterium]
MSAVKEAITAIRDALKLADEVKQVGESLKGVAMELREHDRRLTRLEAKWETALELAGIRSGTARRLEDKD